MDNITVVLNALGTIITPMNHAWVNFSNFFSNEAPVAVFTWVVLGQRAIPDRAGTVNKGFAVT
jgi:hypothetical protein